MLRRHSRRPEQNETAAPQVLETRSAGRHIGFWVWLLPLFALAVFLFVFAIRNYQPGRSEENDRMQAARVAMNFVKDRFGVGTVLRFAPVDSNSVQRVENRYVVNSWVEAVRRESGAAATYEYTCDLSRDSGGDWQLLKMNVQAQ